MMMATSSQGYLSQVKPNFKIKTKSLINPGMESSSGRSDSAIQIILKSHACRKRVLEKPGAGP
jgi:hypothetical protein